MSDLLQWLKDYSAGTVAVIVIGAAALYVIKLIVDKSVGDAVGLRTKALELAISRRSTFEEKVLVDRYEKILELASRLQRVTTNLNRVRQQRNVPVDFIKDGDIASLTDIFEDLQVYRIALTDRFHDLLHAKAKLALQLANAKDDEWKTVGAASLALDQKLREAVDHEFGLSKITWQQAAESQ